RSRRTDAGARGGDATGAAAAPEGSRARDGRVRCVARPGPPPGGVSDGEARPRPVEGPAEDEGRGDLDAVDVRPARLPQRVRRGRRLTGLVPALLRDTGRPRRV